MPYSPGGTWPPGPSGLLTTEQGDRAPATGPCHSLRSLNRHVDHRCAMTDMASHLGRRRETIATGTMSAGGGTVEQKASELQALCSAAEAGETDAEYRLGVLHRDGRDVPEDFGRALELLRRAAGKGHVSAQVDLGAMYARGLGTSADAHEALRWYRAAADKGDALGQYNVGTKYDQGLGVPQDDAEALAWYRRSAEQGFAPAQYNVGNMLSEGRGTPQDYTAAASWYRLAAEQGLAAAQYNLALRYEKGQGVARDPEQALLWYERAAKKGLASAQQNLGVKYFKGEGVAKDYEAAAGWFRMAAEQGHEGAKHNLQAMEANGLVGSYDDATAQKLLRAAMAANDGEYELWPKESVEWARSALMRGQGQVPSVEQVSRAIGGERARHIVEETLSWRAFDNSLKGYRSPCHFCDGTADLQHFDFGLMRVSKSEVKWGATAATAALSAALVPLIGAGAVRLPSRSLEGALLSMKLVVCRACQTKESNWIGLFMPKERHAARHPLWESLQTAGFTKYLEAERVPFEARQPSNL